MKKKCTFVARTKYDNNVETKQLVNGNKYIC